MKRAAIHVFQNASCYRPIARHNAALLSTMPPLTRDQYSVKRGKYATLTDKDVQFFENLLSKTRVLTEESDVEAHNIDWLRSCRGSSRCVLKPKTTEEVSAILKYCNERRLAVCPQGGNTGLVGGGIPVFDEVVIATSLMNKILSLDTLSGVMTCQGGCVLEQLETHAQEHDFMMPLDLGAKGSCHIGGNVSTNAGGLRLVRYGNLHGSVLGIEAVLANGDVVNCLSGMKKDNTGYHLKHLFIGSEGTLGIVTKVAIQCPILPKAFNVALIGLESFDKVLETFKSSKRDIGEILSSCEMMDQDALQVVKDNLKLKIPIRDCPFYMLLETSGSKNEHDQEKMSQFLESALEKGQILDGVLASEPSRAKRVFEIRERIPEALMMDGHFYLYDISLNLKDFYAIVPVMRERLKKFPGLVRVNGFGHLGDGNLHLNITSKEFSPEILSSIEPFVFEWTSKVGGSISAEHGIGFRKTEYMHFSKSAGAIQLMHQIKKMMDPNCILNPYKVLPRAEL